LVDLFCHDFVFYISVSQLLVVSRAYSVSHPQFGFAIRRFSKILWSADGKADLRME
jgi:hypothetical protein